MKKIKKIKIKINGKIKSITQNSNLSIVLKNLKIPLNKVAIELNEEIIDKKKINKIKLNKNDKIVIIKPDHGSRYLAKVYNDEWMRKQNFI